MTKNLSEKTVNKKGNFLKISIILLSLAIIFYFGFKYLMPNKVVDSQAVETTQFDNELFEVSEEYKASDYDLTDLTISQMREKGAEFIYQMLLKNQLQIESLKSDVRSLQDEVRKYKSHEKIGKMILSYVSLREKIFFSENNKENYSKELSNFELLSLNDEVLKKLNLAFVEKLNNFSSNQELKADFQELKPELIAIKNHGNSDEFLAKVRRNISKIITIRRVDKIDGNDVDAVISRVEKSLKEKDFAQALADLNSLEEQYHDALMPFVSKLGNRVDIEKLDQKIINHLEKLI